MSAASAATSSTASPRTRWRPWPRSAGRSPGRSPPRPTRPADPGPVRAGSADAQGLVDLGPVPRPEGGHRRGRGDDHRVAPRRPGPPGPVPAGGPLDHLIAEHQRRCTVDEDERAVGEIGPRQRMEPPPVRPGHEPFPVQPPVHLGGRRPVDTQPIRPGGPVGVVGGPPALGAGPVPGGERDGLVVEEQQRVVVRLPLLLPPPPELQCAGDPQIPAVEPDDLPPPVEDPPVPGPRAPPGKGHDVPQRCHPIPCRPHREEDIYVTPPARRSAPKPARKPPRRPVRVARVYDPPDPDDGVRVLVDRLWPRGLKKADAALDHWCKDVAPSNDLRTWYRHDPALFEEFATRSRAELDGTPQAAALAAPGSKAPSPS